MIEGLLLGALSPAIGCLLGNWAPPGEKSRFGSLIGCGTQLGTVIGQILAGVISYPRLVDLNTEPQTFMYISYWPYVHYLFGVLNVLFALLWSVIVYDRPQKHPWISNKEKQYLIENIYNDVNAINTVNQAEKPNITDKAEKSIENGKIFAVDNFMQRTESLPPNISVEQTQWEFWKFSVPWKAILQSKSVWSVLICHFVYDWGWFTLVTCMPTYLSRVLGFNILSNSFLSSIPYIVQIVVSLTVAFLSDIFIVHKLLSTTWIRRVNNFIALAGLGIGIISVGLVGCNAYVAVGIFSVTVGLMGFSAAGFFSNTLDIAAPYAGNISSIASTFASVSEFSHH
ncbi:unnamed protein product [Heterobilharzia americana]|nr:unnamed protein product [Heterobilharzia americana]